MKHFVFFLAIASILGLTSPALGANSTGVLVSTSLYTTSETDDGVHSLNFVEGGTNIGYISASGLYYGVTYNFANWGSSSVKESYGLSIGWFSNGFYGIASYLVSAKEDLFSGTAVYKNASGYKAEIGYLIPWGNSFHFGISASYRSITYKSVFNGSGNETKIDETDVKSIAPALLFGFIF